ncbi:MAG: helix-turn-helix domain-containing protein [Gammaproteobacteria bacterium]|nr:helix-turn-helix domain-containing protein [Gammaproteobacteria bacterium]
MNRRTQKDISRKLRILNHAKEIGNVSKTCRYFGIFHEAFYKWKRAYEAHGEIALIDSRLCMS